MIGIGPFRENHIRLASSVLSAMALGKGDQLFLYPDYNPERDEARLIATLHPVSLGHYKGETRGEWAGICRALTYLSERAKLVEIMLRRGRTYEYSLEYVIIPSGDREEKEITDFLHSAESDCKLVYHQRVTELGGKTIGWIQPIATMTPYVVTIDEMNRICLPNQMDDFTKRKLGLMNAKLTIQVAHPESGRMIILFRSTSDLADLRFHIMDLENKDFIRFLEALCELGLKPEAVIKRTVSSPVEANVQVILDFSFSPLAQLFSRSKNSLDELKPKINGKIREIRGDITGIRREDVVLEIEQFAPYRADSDEPLDSLKEIQSKEGE
jgi:hypothetical protein